MIFNRNLYLQKLISVDGNGMIKGFYSEGKLKVAQG